MWLFTSFGMLSIVQSATDKSQLVVRSREPGVVEHLFPQAKVTQTAGRDYLYRAYLPRQQVADRVAQYVLDLAYGNFKDSIPMSKELYHDVCFKVWSNMAAIQPYAPYSLTPRQPVGKRTRKPKKGHTAALPLSYRFDDGVTDV